MSIKGDIIDNIKTTIEGITTGNGYSQTVAHVNTDSIKLPEDLTADQFPAVNVVDVNETKTPGDIDSKNSILEVMLLGYVQKLNDQDNVQTKRRNLENDIEKALMVDETRGGKAIFTEITKIETDKGIIDNYSETYITATIQYYHNRNNPGSQDNSPV